MRPRKLLIGCVVLGTAGGFALISALGGKAAAPGGVVIEAQPSLLSYQFQGHPEGHGDESPGAHFTVTGNAPGVLYPGTSSTIDLSFTNDTNEAINVPAGALKITISSPRSSCPASPNFSVVRSLTTTIRIPKSATNESLADLHVTSRFWPVISMVTTHATQDPCAGMAITLHYSTQSHGDGD